MSLDAVPDPATTSAMVQPPRCGNCSAILEPPGLVCTACHSAQRTGPESVAVPPTVLLAAKSAGLAAFLSFLWPGAGLLYAGQIGAGIAFVMFGFFLFVVSLTGVGLILTLPLWLIVTPFLMIWSYNAAKSANRRMGAVATW